MEQNLPIITKKLWNMVRLAFFMLKKGICNNKILFNLNMMMKRGKLASKVILNNLIFHHYHSHLQASTTWSGATTSATGEYIYSGGATPLYLHQFTKKKKGFQYQQECFFSCTSSPNFETESLEAINKKSGFIVRQVRITDSPYPLKSEENCDNYVDMAADSFIKKFYSRIKEED